jgi:hypothetical protein
MGRLYISLVFRSQMEQAVGITNMMSVPGLSVFAKSRVNFIGAIYSRSILKNCGLVGDDPDAEVKGGSNCSNVT